MLSCDRYEPVPIRTWDGFLDWYQEFSKSDSFQAGKWIFRGLKRADYDLSTSLERAALDLGIPPNQVPEREARILHDFMRRLHHYRQDVPEHDDTVEWMSIMQHHGAPTRLLDWTYSLFVATFFAVEEYSNHCKCAVFALDYSNYDVESSIDRIGEPVISCHYESGPEHKRLPPYADDPKLWQKAVINYVLENPKRQVFAVNPFRLNERLSIQQGVFLLPGDISKTFEDNLNVNDKERDKLTKIEICSDAAVRRAFLYNLHRMNINRATLFPGLVGFSESLRTRVGIPEILSF